MLVFGKNVALSYLDSGKKINKVYLQDKFNEFDIINRLNKKNIRIEYLSRFDMDKKVNGLHQGIILDVEDYKYADIDEIIDGDNLIVMLDHIEDPHNFGAIIRTCEAAGIHSIIIPKDRQVPVNATVMKTSVGTLDNMNIVSVANIASSLNRLKDAGYWIVGTALENSVDYRAVDYSGKIALVIGNEGSGISQLVSRECDYLVKIPMYGKTNSLNASVAAGIMIYEVIRNRK